VAMTSWPRPKVRAQPPWLHGMCVLTTLSTAMGLRPLDARQGPLMPGLVVGIVSQSSPITNESGVVIGTTITIPLIGSMAVRPAVEYLRAHQTSGIAVCARIRDDPPECLARPDAERLLSFGVEALVELQPGDVIGPYFTMGASFLRSLESPNPGERRAFLAPQLGAGILVRLPFGAISIGGRWRRINRWSPHDATNQVSGLIAVRLAA